MATGEGAGDGSNGEPSEQFLGIPAFWFGSPDHVDVSRSAVGELIERHSRLPKAERTLQPDRRLTYPYRELEAVNGCQLSGDGWNGSPERDGSNRPEPCPRDGGDWILLVKIGVGDEPVRRGWSGQGLRMRSAGCSGWTERFLFRPTTPARQRTHQDV